MVWWFLPIYGHCDWVIEEETGKKYDQSIYYVLDTS